MSLTSGFKKVLEGIAKQPRAFFCMNDDEPVSRAVIDREIRKFLSTMFPTPSPYEQTDS